MNDIMSDRLAALKENGLYRARESFEPLDATHVRSDGRKCLMLAANNYLGLTHNPRIQNRAAAAAAAYGAGSGGSRLTTGNHSLYDALEGKLAEFKETEQALVFSSGYTANVGVISALAGPDDVVFSDELNHASIVDGCRLARTRTVIYRHCDTADLAAKLAAVSCQGLRFIVTDGVFSMDGDIAPLDEIVALAKRHAAFVMVDDAHATGVVGPGGKGTAAYYNLEGQVQVQLGTLSKALAAEGGYVAGSRALVDYLVNKARSFIFSTALAPATTAAALAALAALAADPGLVTRLRDNAIFMRQALGKAGLSVPDGETPIIPINVGAAALAVNFAAKLRAEGIIVSAIRPPAVPVGGSRLRITVSAAHSRAELAAAAATIGKIAATLGIGG